MTDHNSAEWKAERLAELPKDTKMLWFRHCGEPMQIAIGHRGPEETDDYQTYAACSICKLLLLIKDGPWSDVQKFKATHIDIQ